ncbi:hypothetical protein K438DRAFT_1782734 [Mycena galopus ATCC 62051]|nr:hypothetical protein K438DRAFT_1782734 [Mycena galopus ATCC 62051]
MRLRRVILIFGWFLGELSQLMMYSAKYSDMYPGAAQVMIRSDVLAGIGSRTTNINRQPPIINKLEQLGLFSETPPRVLIHIFSGGGSMQLLWLLLALESRPPQTTTRPFTTCLVIDSAPGNFHHATVQKSLALPFSGSTKLAGSAVASLIYVGLQTRSMRRATPRLYFYSDVDQFSLVRDVMAHIEEAREKGLNVREEYFLGTQHLRHSQEYPDRYWNAVRSVWDDAVWANNIYVLSMREHNRFSLRSARKISFNAKKSVRNLRPKSHTGDSRRWRPTFDIGDGIELD